MPIEIARETAKETFGVLFEERATETTKSSSAETSYSSIDQIPDLIAGETASAALIVLPHVPSPRLSHPFVSSSISKAEPAVISLSAMVGTMFTVRI
jgi:hypothetical protein